MSFTPKGLLGAITAAADEETKRQEREKKFTYERQLIEQDGSEGMTLVMTRQEVKDRLIDWVKDPEVAVAYLEATPGEWNRGTPFAYYRALEVTDG